MLSGTAVGLGVAGCPDAPTPLIAEHEDSWTMCHDGLDNDEDDLIDCDDGDCSAHCGGDGDADGDGDGDSDGDADGDADTDADIDADADEEVDPYIRCEGDDDCPPVMMCYEYWADGQRLCAPRGSSCDVDDDCDSGTACDVVPEWSEVGTYCLHSGATCTSDGGCPDGFRCEDGGCADRRFACETNDDCPRWDRCLALWSGLRICLPWSLEPCENDEQCSSPCVDVDGDGDTECQEEIGSSCLTNADCDGMVCGQQDDERGVECGAAGPCMTSADCPGTMECVNVNDDGQLECQELGACSIDANCSPRQLCFDPDSAGGPECVSS